LLLHKVYEYLKKEKDVYEKLNYNFLTDFGTVFLENIIPKYEKLSSVFM